MIYDDTFMFSLYVVVFVIPKRMVGRPIICNSNSSLGLCFAVRFGSRLTICHSKNDEGLILETLAFCPT